MSVGLTDPSAVMAMYESILRYEHNWLLLTYADNIQLDELSLHTVGDGGLSKLKGQIDHTEKVFIAFYREDTGSGPGFIIINYIPTSISGVRRARALVHSRRVGTMFKKHQTTLTVDHLSSLTTTAIQTALAEPDNPHLIQMGRTISQPIGYRRPGAVATESVRRSFSETSAPSSPPPLQQKSGSVFANFLRRKRRSPNSSFDDAIPPPTPPKDKMTMIQQPRRERNRYGFIVQTQIMPHSESAVEYPELVDLTDAFNPNDEQDRPSTSLEQERMDLPSLPVPLRGKWLPGDSMIIDPAERIRRRVEVQRRNKMEEEEALREEAQRQAQLKRQKEEILQQEMEEEARRRSSLESQLRRITAEKRRKEILEREEDERKRQELEERKRLDRMRRLEEHNRLEQWRLEQERLASETARRAEHIRKQEEAERRKRIQLVEARVKRHTTAESLLTGWVTLQTSESLVWKRRFYKFNGSTVYFYRSPKDTSQVLDEMELRGRINGLMEWNEGFEDLKAIPHSFAIVFKDNTRPWSMFADSEEEKDKLLGLLHHISTL